MTLRPAGAATSGQLTSAAHAVRARLSAEGISAHASASGSVVTVSAPSTALAAVVAAALPGVLTFREIYTDPGGHAYTSPAATASSEVPSQPVTVTDLDAPSSEPDQTTPSSATLAQFATLECSKNGGRPGAIDEDPHHYVVACDRTGQMKYLLTPADFVADQLASADAAVGAIPTGQPTYLWEVDVTFRSTAVPRVETVTSRLLHNNKQQLAITLDGVVLSAPSTNGVLGANITISGGTPPFSKGEARELAGIVNAGPLSIALTADGAR
ncbi:MAG TPA: hypothetical protein VIJ71_04010 [Mycobacteriales bacterium]